MGDVPIRPIEETVVTVGRQDHVHDAVAVAITGSSEGRLRRKVLFLVAGLGIAALIALAGVIGLLFGGFALVALLLLAMTDDVVDL